MWKEYTDAEICYALESKKEFKMRKDIFSQQKMKKRVNGTPREKRINKEPQSWRKQPSGNQENNKDLKSIYHSSSAFNKTQSSPIY